VEALVLEKEEPILIHNYDTSAELPAHAGILSSLIVPIAYEGRVAGLFHLHSSSADGFDATALEIAQTLAIQAAIALGNAQRYQEQVARNELLSRRVETLANLMETTRALQAKQTLEEALEDLAYGIQESTPFNVVLISVYDSGTGALQKSAQAGMSILDWEETRRETQSWESVHGQLLLEFRIGRSYFLPCDHIPYRPDDIHYIYAQTYQQQSGKADWNQDDRVLIPLLDASGEPLGVISITDPRDGLRPDRPTLETLDIFASQAALTIESQLKLKELGILSHTLKPTLTVSRKQSHLRRIACRFYYTKTWSKPYPSRASASGSSASGPGWIPPKLSTASRIGTACCWPWGARSSPVWISIPSWSRTPAWKAHSSFILWDLSQPALTPRPCSASATRSVRRSTAATIFSWQI
jgi:GAF domain-containing protein